MMTQEWIPVSEKRKEMTKESWIRNVMRIHPEKSHNETAALYDKIFESDLAISDSLKDESR